MFGRVQTRLGLPEVLTMSRRSFRSQPIKRAARQRGLSIVELLVGSALGLFIVAAAALLVSTQLGENRRMLVETQLMQDLRAATDIIARDLRRASYTPSARQQLWYVNKDAGDWAENGYGEIITAPGEDLTEIQYRYRRRSGDEGPFGFKRDGNLLRTLVAGVWQPLTDERILSITSFEVDLPPPTATQIPCPRACDALGSTACWPEVLTRTVTIRVSATSATDPQVQRSMTTQVRLRNDYTRFNGATACPA